ncbi:hypothetical protein K2173_024455 [Erythroxylum novogranatense]|uniref:DYW domain-containing protein n=1 Tax=Erythroxylum novogranatense TaxID=1862640 RepID=A0AAV8SVF2_9ROSI|nr:hypothetical protein K2173_024455 [Erythroxylum novogranatense]
MVVSSIRRLQRIDTAHFPCPLALISFDLLHSLASPTTTEQKANNPDLQTTSVLIFRRTTSDYASVLQSCITYKALAPGKQLHARLFQVGLGLDTHLATKLVNLYSVCTCLRSAHLLFDKICKKSLFLWNVLIRGYAWCGPHEVAVQLYRKMIDYGLVPDNYTFPFVLKACSALSAIEDGREIHELVRRTGWERDVYVGAALIDMYAKCGFVGNAREVFYKIGVKDAVLWNSMLAAYSQNGKPNDALTLCNEMVLEGLRPNEATLVTVISASADMAALMKGRELHGFAWRLMFESNDRVKTSLMDMYAKCGSVKISRVLFELLKEKRVVSWNAMITGYAMHGHSVEAIDLFERMRDETTPDHVTYVGVLSACSHGGLLDEGWLFFQTMKTDYHIEPTVQHYTCMVDLLGRSARLSEAYDLIMQMRVVPDSGVWGALLNSCKIHQNVDFAELALEKLIELEPNDAGNYVILSNIYAQTGKWKRVAKLRKLITERGLKKTIACSWIDVKNKVHVFLSGDTSHPDSEKIYSELRRLEERIKAAGYITTTGSVFHDVEDDDKITMVFSHSERLAIAFGLINTPPRTRLMITKNLNICEDCHDAIKFISKITEREIMIRDVNFYHKFKDGFCSCGDYW